MEIHRDMCLCIVYERNNSEVLLNMKVLLNISICYSILVFQKNDSRREFTYGSRKKPNLKVDDGDCLLNHDRWYRDIRVEHERRILHRKPKRCRG